LKSLRSNKERHYLFDINQANAIFDWLSANKKVKFKGKHKQMTNEELKGKSYCKCHRVIGHSTKNYVIFRNVIQDLLKLKHIRFPDKNGTIKVNKNPFSLTNTLSMNMMIVANNINVLPWNVSFITIITNLVESQVFIFIVDRSYDLEGLCRWHIISSWRFKRDKIVRGVIDINNEHILLINLSSKTL